MWGYSQVHLNKRIASMGLQVAGGKVCSVVVVYVPNCTADYLAYLGSLVGVLEGLPSGDPKVLLRDFYTHVGNSGVTWRGMIGSNSLPDLNWGGVLFFDFCACHGLAITDTMFERKAAHKCTWHQTTLSQRSMIVFMCHLICDCREWHSCQLIATR